MNDYPSYAEACYWAHNDECLGEEQEGEELADYLSHCGNCGHSASAEYVNGVVYYPCDRCGFTSYPQEVR